VPDNFDSIRTWEGAKHRAFEEICYQLLREPEDLPTEMQGLPIRTGNPDGGVEWYALTTDGKEWGWQAKYINDIDNLLNAMTSTVNRVVEERKQLTRLIFCIPWNLSTGKAKGKRKSARKKYEDKVATWKSEIRGADKIDFVLIQGSDLLDRLALPKHAGRVWFWWNEPYLGPDWLARFLRQQANVAGERYRPKLQVDVPIQDDISALGFSDPYFDELNRHARPAVDRLREISPPSTRLGEQIVTSTRAVTDATSRLASIVSAADYQAEKDDPLNELNEAVTACLDAIGCAQEQARTAEATVSNRPPEEGRPSDAELLRMHSYPLGRASNALYGLKQYLESSASRAVRERFYFLTGSGGTGKTHLCLDSVQRALNEKRPAAVLFGSQFGVGDLWSSICDQLGLPNLGADTLLGALEAVAEASSLNGRRFVFMVDAINDTRAENYWASRLPALSARFAEHPLLSLLVSCRDTYIEYVDPEGRCKRFTRAHPGFAGREFEATHKYFEVYGLQEPRIPLLLPEFAVPLFLVTYCEGLKGEGQAAPPAGHESRVDVFERFLRVVLRRVAQRLSLASASPKVRAVLDVLLDEMSTTGSEYVRFDRAEELTQAALPERTEWPETGLGALLSEGLLNQELIYEGDDRVEAVRITYQAFSDFLILRRRLEDIPAEAAPDETFVAWMSRASWGVREAAALLLPERHGVELPDLLEPSIRAETADAQWADRKLSNLDEMAVRSFPYRRPQAVTERSIEILNRHASGAGGIRALLDVTFLCASQPDSLLNGDGLHSFLTGYSMPQRDASFGVTLYHDIFDESSPLSRLARWAAEGPYPAYEVPVVELACIPLVWMLSSPNRFARDWITKALVQLLSGHLSVAAILIERFASMNDPYVLERMVTVAYGAILRGGLAHKDQAARVANAVEQMIFGRLGKLLPDALMVDSARGIIEWAVAHELLPEASLTAARPPYGFKRPSNPPTKEQLDKLYPSGEGTTEQTSYGSIYISVLSFGDFGRYVIESGVQHFMRTPLSQPRPLPDPPARPRLLVTHWRRFIKSLSPEQRERVEALCVDSAGETVGISPLTALREFRSSPLTAEQSELLRKSWHTPAHRSRHDLSYPADRAQRWVFQRTATLGWTPQLFGSFDRYANRGDAGRTSHKNERFGKKYQWIAYHELLARIADNYYFSPGYSDEPETFEGLYQINDREIDPSLPPVPYREFQSKVVNRGTWPPLEIDFPNVLPGVLAFQAYRGDYRTFLDDHATLPRPESVARITDAENSFWIILCAHASQTERARNREQGNEGGEQFYTLNSWLVERPQAEAAANALPVELKDDSLSRGLMDRTGHVDCCYFGELGWLDVQCPHRQVDPIPLIDDEVGSISGFATTEEYLWEGSIWDCSIEERARAVLPSTFLQRSGSLRWTGSTREWFSESNAVIANVELTLADGSADLLVVREVWLQDFLAAHDMVVVYGVRGERRNLDRPQKGYTWLEFEVSGVYKDGNLETGQSEIELKSN
jgi:hypothetical protein